MEAIAQLVEYQIVALVVTGSNPVSLPKEWFEYTAQGGQMWFFINNVNNLLHIRVV